jgi:hypothetical protein
MPVAEMGLCVGVLRLIFTEYDPKIQVNIVLEGG